MSGYPWTLRNQARLWWYNTVKRPWRNFLWRYWLDPARWALKREKPHLANVFPHGHEGKMTRADMEWAWSVVRDLPPVP